MSKFLTFLSKLTAFILSTIFLFILIGLVALFLTENLFSKSNISTIIENVDLKEIKVSDNNEQKTAFDYVYNYTSQLGLTKEATEELLKEEDVNKILTDYFSDIANFYLYGQDIPTYTKEQIMLDITKINNLLPAEKQISLTEEQVEKTTEEINNLSETLTTKQVLVNQESTFLTFNDSYLKNAKIYMLISLIIIFFLIALIRFKLYSPLGWCGIPMIMVGCFYMLFSLTKYAIKALETSLEKYQYIIDLLSNSIFNKSLIYGIIILVIGLVMTIIYNVIRNKKDYQEETLDDKELDEELDKL